LVIIFLRVPVLGTVRGKIVSQNLPSDYLFILHEFVTPGTYVVFGSIHKIYGVQRHTTVESRVVHIFGSVYIIEGRYSVPKVLHIHEYDSGALYLFLRKDHSEAQCGGNNQIFLHYNIYSYFKGVKSIIF